MGIAKAVQLQCLYAQVARGKDIREDRMKDSTQEEGE